MVISLFISHLNAGGATRVCVNLSNEWVRLGHEVHILTLDEPSGNCAGVLDDSVNVHPLGVSRFRYAALPFIRYIRKNRPPFVLIFGTEMGIIAHKLKKWHLINIPIIERVLNNIDVKLGAEENVPAVIEAYIRKSNAILKDMDYLITQCQSMENQLIEYHVAEKDKISVIYNPVSRELTSEVIRLRKERQISSTREVTFIGRIDPQKNVPHLLQAFRIVHEKMPNTVLRLVGSAHMDDAMKAYAVELGISDYVLFDGVRRDMENVYAGADVVVLTSEYEGLPNCLIEAIASGIPIVSYDCPMGPSEIVVDGINGYLVEYNNIHQMAERVIEALERKWDADMIISTSEKFNSKIVAEKYLKIFGEINEQ